MATTEQIKAWLAANSDASDVDIRNAMNKHGVGIGDMADATGMDLMEINRRYSAAGGFDWEARRRERNATPQQQVSPSPTPTVGNTISTPSVNTAPTPVIPTTPAPSPQPTPHLQPQQVQTGGSYPAPRLNLGNLYRFGGFGQQQQQQPNFQQPMGNQNSLYNMLAGLFGFGGSGGRGGQQQDIYGPRDPRSPNFNAGFPMNPGGSRDWNRDSGEWLGVGSNPSNRGRPAPYIDWSQPQEMMIAGPQGATYMEPDFSNVRPAGMGMMPGGLNVSAAGAMPRYAQGGSNNPGFNNDIGWPSNYAQASTGFPNYSNVRPAGMGMMHGGPNVSAVGAIPQYAQGGGMPSWMNADIMNYMGGGRY